MLSITSFSIAKPTWFVFEFTMAKESPAKTKLVQVADSTTLNKTQEG